jgi:hypothetical protein
MSLDNELQVGEQGVDDLVPSRYAVQVGEIDVMVISDGVLPITASTLATNADSADLASWLDDQFLPPCAPVVAPSSSTLGWAWSSPTFRGPDRLFIGWRPPVSIPDL